MKLQTGTHLTQEKSCNPAQRVTGAAGLKGPVPLQEISYLQVTEM